MKKARLRLALLEAKKNGGNPGQRRWPAGTPGSRGGEFAPQGAGGGGFSAAANATELSGGLEPPRVGYAVQAPGGGFAKVPEGTLRKNRVNYALANAAYAQLVANGASDDELAMGAQAVLNAKIQLETRKSNVKVERDRRRGVRNVEQTLELDKLVEEKRQAILGSRGEERKKARAEYQQAKALFTASAENTMNDPNIQRVIGRALSKGEIKKAVWALGAATVGGVAGQLINQIVFKSMGEPTKGRSVFRAGMAAGGKFLNTPAGKTVAIGFAGLGAVTMIREFMPKARRQLDHSLLVKYDRNSRIEWQKHQTIFGKDGGTATPGQMVTVGHSRRPAVYLGAEWRPQGANPTTTGRLIVQRGKKVKAVKYRDVKGVKDGRQMGEAEAMALARKTSEKTWTPPAISGKRALLKAATRKLEPRLKKEATTEIRALRQGGTTKDKALAYGLERAKSQAFSKELRRKRKRHSRPNARKKNAIKRLATGRARPGDARYRGQSG